MIQNVDEHQGIVACAIRASGFGLGSVERPIQKLGILTREDSCSCRQAPTRHLDRKRFRHDNIYQNLGRHDTLHTNPATVVYLPTVYATQSPLLHPPQLHRLHSITLALTCLSARKTHGASSCSLVKCSATQPIIRESTRRVHHAACHRRIRAAGSGR